MHRMQDISALQAQEVIWLKPRYQTMEDISAPADCWKYPATQAHGNFFFRPLTHVPSHLPVSSGSRLTKDFASAYLAKVNLSHVVHLRLC